MHRGESRERQATPQPLVPRGGRGPTQGGPGARSAPTRPLPRYSRGNPKIRRSGTGTGAWADLVEVLFDDDGPYYGVALTCDELALSPPGLVETTT